jgi:hypothetical protein
MTGFMQESPAPLLAGSGSGFIKDLTGFGRPVEAIRFTETKFGVGGD